MVSTRPRAGTAQPKRVLTSLRSCEVFKEGSELAELVDPVGEDEPQGGNAEGCMFVLCLLVPSPVHRPKHAATRQRRQKQKQDGEGWDVGADMSVGSVACLLQGLLLRAENLTADQEAPGSAPGALFIAPFFLHPC